MIHGWEKDEGWTCIYIGKERDLGRSGGVRMAVMSARSALPDPSGSPAHLRIGFLRWNRGKGRAKEHKLKERMATTRSKLTSLSGTLSRSTMSYKSFFKSFFPNLWTILPTFMTLQSRSQTRSIKRRRRRR